MSSNFTAKRRWYVPTPAKLVCGVLLVELGLLCSDPANAWMLLTGVGVLVAAIALGLVWLLGGLLWRRRFQFGIGTLLLSMVVVALVGGWFSWKLQRAQRQKRATEALREAGFSVRYDCQTDELLMMPDGAVVNEPGPIWLRQLFRLDFVTDVVELEKSGSGDLTDARLKDAVQSMQLLPRLTHLYIGRNPITDEGVKHLVELPGIVSLSLANTQITDAGLYFLRDSTRLEFLDVGDTTVTDKGLAHLRNLTRLKRLYLYETQVGDQSLKYIAGMTELEDLELCGTRITDAGLANLRMLERLKYLGLDETQITGDGLVRLAGLVYLEDLDLSKTRIKDEDLRHLKPMVSLWGLSLHDTDIGDAGVAQLREFKGLRGLGLCDTQITDAGLLHLHEMTQLECLDISGPKMTNEGLTKLFKALPDVAHQRGGGGYSNGPLPAGSGGFF